MTLEPPSAAHPSSVGLWSDLVRAHVDGALTQDAVARLVIVGPAGSDKTPLLRHIRERVDTRADARIVFVDDAHLLGDDELAQWEEVLDDDSTGLVLACRPWPRSERLRLMLRRIEQTGRAVVLGQVTARDAEAIAMQNGRHLDAACIRSLLEISGSVTWLVREAIAAHGDGPCTDSSHDAITRALIELVAERLRTVDAGTAAIVRRVSLRGPGAEAPIPDEDAARGHAEGLLLRNGQAIPLVRSAVLRTTPVTELVTLLDEYYGPPTEIVASLGRMHDPRLARALMGYADRAAAADPRRAHELYEAARTAGGDALEVAVRLSRLAWERGEIDEAAAALDATAIPLDHHAHDEAVDLMGAIWSARGYMEVSAATYRTQSLHDALVTNHAAVAALGSGDAEILHTEREGSGGGVPTTLSVSMRLLSRGLRASVSESHAGALDDLVRASRTYGESGTTDPAPEVPAVLAALTAINVGELDTADTILADALLEEHGGPWARPRLLLWAAWTALQRQRPDDAAARLDEIDASPRPLGAREVVLRDAVLLNYARHFGTPAELRALWDRVRDDLRRIEPDLYALHAVGEFLVTSALFGDAGRFDSAQAACQVLLDQLGEPSLWSAHLHWAAAQRGVLLGDRGIVEEHIDALRGMTAGNHVASAMVDAASEWMRVQSGTVDADAVVRAASRLAEVGLAWDGARLALLAALGAPDRRAGARLADVSRRLHPRAQTATFDGSQPAVFRDEGVLSAREREVAALVLRGKTYAEIGQAMFISPRTAEHHIARIRRRLGATSRADLLGKLRAIVDIDPEEADERRAG